MRLRARADNGSSTTASANLRIPTRPERRLFIPSPTRPISGQTSAPISTASEARSRLALISVWR